MGPMPSCARYSRWRLQPAGATASALVRERGALGGASFDAVATARMECATRRQRAEARRAARNRREQGTAARARLLAAGLLIAMASLRALSAAYRWYRLDQP